MTQTNVKDDTDPMPHMVLIHVHLASPEGDTDPMPHMVLIHVHLASTLPQEFPTGGSLGPYVPVLDSP